MSRKTPKQSPKRVLRRPDLVFAKSAVLNTLRSPESKRSFRFAIDDFVAWYCRSSMVREMDSNQSVPSARLRAPRAFMQ